MGTALALLTTFVVGWILFNLVGAFIVGLIARAIFPGKDKVGWLATIGIGFLGGILGKLVFWLLRWPTGFPMGFVASVAGAFVLLYVYHLRVTRRAASSG